MNWYDVMGLVSTIALSLPILTIIATGLPAYRTFPVLLIYYTISFGYNLLTEGYIETTNSFTYYYGIINNLLDPPLMIVFLTYFTTSVFKKRMLILAAAFIGFEILVLALYGMTLKTITIIMGPGILIILSFALPFFVHQTKITIFHQKAVGKAMIAAAILFAYGCFSIIYIMYYVLRIPDVQNTFLVYFFVSTFSSIMLSAGIVLERKRVRKLSELMVVRKELSQVYGKEKTPTPLGPAMFDFDKDQWN